MTTTPTAPAATHHGDRAVARTTGLLYLALGLTGMLGFLLIRPQLVGDDAGATAASLVDHEALTRVGIALELGVVVSQALVAAWFYRLFRLVDHVTAGVLAAFGMMNAAAFVGSAAAFGTALQVALDPVGGPGASGVLMGLSENFWAVGGVFFGLWLLPMGMLALRSDWLPDLLGRVLLVGGVGYVAKAFLDHLFPDAWGVEMLVIPATVGEFWMIGCLLFRPPRR